MKLVKLAHPSQVRSVPEGELDRLLAQGWTEIKPVPSKRAIIYRKLRRRRKLLGEKRISAYLSAADAEALLASRLPGETVAQLLVRLLHLSTEQG
ncbi:hypothetical protein D3C77_260610 [compost metagenome]